MTGDEFALPEALLGQHLFLEFPDHKLEVLSHRGFSCVRILSHVW
jgi:hypothetical protein